MAKIYPIALTGNKLTDINSACLNIASSAVLYGLSVYTVFPIFVGKDDNLVAFRLQDHFTRLCESAKIIGIDGFIGHWDFEKFLQTVGELVTANKIKSDIFVRATIHVDEILPGTRSRGLHTVFSMFAYDVEPIVSQNGTRLKTSVWRRVPDHSIPSRAKVNGAYVNSVLAKQDALDSGYDDCIFLDAQGHVCELSAANIFLVRDGKLITPDKTSDLLEGINRRTLIEQAEELGIEVEERPVDLTELYIANEVFACGTSAFVAPVVEIDSRVIDNGQSGPLTRQLKKLHENLLRGSDERYSLIIEPIKTKSTVKSAA
jgi:branched-chain amino acid aminotransferase